MLDLTGNNELSAMCAEWLKAKKELQIWKEKEATSRICIINALNKEQVDNIKVGQFEIQRVTRKGSEGRTITLDDVALLRALAKDQHQF